MNILKKTTLTFMAIVAGSALYAMDRTKENPQIPLSQIKMHGMGVLEGLTWMDMAVDTLVGYREQLGLARQARDSSKTTRLEKEIAKYKKYEQALEERRRELQAEGKHTQAMKYSYVIDFLRGIPA